MHNCPLFSPSRLTFQSSTYIWPFFSPSSPVHIRFIFLEKRKISSLITYPFSIENSSLNNFNQTRNLAMGSSRASPIVHARYHILETRLPVFSAISSSRRLPIYRNYANRFIAEYFFLFFLHSRFV